MPADKNTPDAPLVVFAPHRRGYIIRLLDEVDTVLMRVRNKDRASERTEAINAAYYRRRASFREREKELKAQIEKLERQSGRHFEERRKAEKERDVYVGQLDEARTLLETIRAALAELKETSSLRHVLDLCMRGIYAVQVEIDERVLAGFEKIHK